MKTVVDTSVWRSFFAGDVRAEGLSALLLGADEVLLHPWVLGELTLGGLARGDAQLLSALPAAEVISEDVVLEFIGRRRLARRGVGWVDVNLLATALVAGASLWTLDVALGKAARSLGLAHRP